MKRKLIAMLLCLAMLAVDVNYAFADELGMTEVTSVETEVESAADEAELEEAVLEEEEGAIPELEDVMADDVQEENLLKETETALDAEKTVIEPETAKTPEDVVENEVDIEATQTEEERELEANAFEEQPGKEEAEPAVIETETEAEPEIETEPEIKTEPSNRGVKMETQNRADEREIINSGTCGDNLTWTLYEDGELIISGTGDMYDYYVDWGEKASYEYAPWYSNRSSIIKVYIEAGVTSIGQGAFNWCNKLSEVTIPNSVSSIGVAAFYECYKLADLHIPEGVLSIGSDAFYECRSLTSVVIPKSVTSLGSRAFFNCGNLKEATLLNEKMEIGNYALFFIYGDWDDEICDGATLYGYSESTAEEYAAKNNIKFVIYCEHNNTHEVTATEPTCHSWGYTAGVYCDDCGRYVSGHEWVNKISHTDENEDGICDICGKKAAKPIEMGFCGDDLLWEMFADGELIISGTGEMYDYSSLDEGDKKASKPSPWYYSYRDDIQTLSIEEGATSIGAYAFYDCYNLKNVNMPESLTRIGSCAFQYCSALTRLIISDAVTEIGASAFYYCSNLMRVIIPCGVTELKGYTFYECDSLSRVDILNDDISIDTNAFRYSYPTLYAHKDSATQKFAEEKGYEFVELCRHLNTIEKTAEEPTCSSYGYTAGVYCYDCGEYISGHKRIDKLPHADENSDGICEVCGKRADNPVEVGYCGDNLIWEFYGDGELIISGTGEMYDYSAYTGGDEKSARVASPWNESHRQDVKTVSIEAGVTRIGDCAFYDCTNLKTVNLPETLVCIGNDAFYNCDSLANIIIPISVTVIEEYAFYSCYGLKRVDILNDNITIEEGAFSSSRPTIHGHKGTAIERFAYEHGLTFARICSHRDEDGDGICEICGGRMFEVVAEGFCGVGGSYHYDDWDYEYYTYGENLTWILYEDGVMVISGEGDMSSFEEISAPWSSFRDSIVKAIIEDGVTKIGYEAFEYCQNLQTVLILNGNVRFDEYVFYYCSEELVLQSYRWSGVQNYAENYGIKFEIYCEHFHTEAVLATAPTCTAYGYTAGILCNDCEQYISGHEKIDKLPHKDEDGNDVCDVCKRSLVVVSSGKCGKKITWTLYKDGYLELNGSGEMTNYSQGKTPWNSKKATITTVELSEGITNICHYAFQDCENLKKVILSEGLEEIQDSAFENCINLTEVLLPDSLTYICKNVFENCTHIKNIVLPEGLRYIDYDAFRYCSQLQSINIPRLINEICSDTFSECTSLTEVVIPGSVNEIRWYAFSGCSKLSKVIFLGKYTADEDEEYSGCSIDETAFEGCSSSLVIYGYEGTDIEYYAECNAFTFKALPAITTQPKNTAVGVDKKATLSVKAYGLDDPQYQWYYRPSADDDWQPVGEESGTAAVYSFTTVAGQDGYQYRCKVFNEEKTLTSNTVTLTIVTAKPTIKTQPKDTAVASTKKATFTIAATGKALSYQWYYRTSSTASWKKLTASSAKTATYSVTAESTKHGYQYYCAVTNPMGTVKSNTVTLTVVTAKPTIKTQPKAQTVKVGTKVTFKVVASGRALSYQWSYRTSSSDTWKKITSGTKASYSVTTAKKHNGYQYKCVVTNAKGSVTSKIVTLTVVAAKPTIKTQPTAVSVKSGAKATFKIVASGTALSYQWYRRTSSTAKWVKISGATKATYSFTTAKKQNGYQYKCVVTNLMGDVTSKIVKLTVK